MALESNPALSLPPTLDRVWLENPASSGGRLAGVAEERALSFSPALIYATLTSAVMPKVARDQQLLHVRGYGPGCLEPVRSRQQEIIQDLPIEDRRPAVERVIQADLDELRSGLLLVEQRDGLLRAFALVSCIGMTKTINHRYGSYGLKHIAEDLDYHLPGNVMLPVNTSGTQSLLLPHLCRFPRPLTDFPSGP